MATITPLEKSWITGIVPTQRYFGVFPARVNMKAPMAESGEAIEIGGSIREGGGQVLRTCLALGG